MIWTIPLKAIPINHKVVFSMNRSIPVLFTTSLRPSGHWSLSELFTHFLPDCSPALCRSRSSISPQGSLKFHLSPCLCLEVINSRWTEHDDGSAQYFCTIHTDKGGKEHEIYVQHFEFCLHLQSAILLLYISQIICSIILKTFETLGITAGVTVS